MKEFVEYIIKNLVDNPDSVKINEIGGSQLQGTHFYTAEIAVRRFQ